MTRKKRLLLGLAGAGLLALFLLAANWRSIGRQMANPLRQALGVHAVAQIETAIFKVQDQIEQWKYDLGLAEPENPFEMEAFPEGENPAPSPSVLPPTETRLPSTATPRPASPENSSQNPKSVPPPAATPIPPSPTPSGWALPNLKPFGDLPGEGIWQPYLYTPEGIAAYRTFLQPDSERPYALVAAVAVDLNRVDLHFVLGLEEPSKPGGPHGWGNIPREDRQPGRLLAAFNGGFIAEHGGYGAMADGVTALAARAGLMTLAIYKDGAVRIGVWGDDFYTDGDYRAWRQNAIPIIHNGEINEKVYTGSEADWGANLDGATVTLRSSVGIDAEQSVLYYFAGPSLSMPALAEAMARAGVYNGMLLDINPTHAHFTAMRVEDGALVAEPLYPEVMDLWVDRYLHQWNQDFFYVTPRDAGE